MKEFNSWGSKNEAKTDEKNVLPKKRQKNRMFLHDELFGQVDVVASYRLSYRSRSRHCHLCLQRVEVRQILSRAIVDSACFVWLVVFSLMSRAGAGNTL